MPMFVHQISFPSTSIESVFTTPFIGSPCLSTSFCSQRDVHRFSNFLQFNVRFYVRGKSVGSCLVFFVFNVVVVRVVRQRGVKEDVKGGMERDYVGIVRTWDRPYSGGGCVRE